MGVGEMAALAENEKSPALAPGFVEVRLAL
jgi:hypothetical protein